MLGLGKIREKNKRKDNFVNTDIDYSSLSAKEIEDIRKDTFKGFIEPLIHKNVEKLIRF
ncbi:MAG: hypothetical protein ACRC68_04885 [Clostridium sp.]